jgi:plastocyanin
MRSLSGVAAALALLAPARAAPGDVAGVVRWAGPPPAAAPLEVTKDRGTCGETQPDESLLVRGGGLANVVVAIAVPGAPAAPRSVVLDQRGCRYVPHVVAAPVGSSLELRSQDPILHGVHGYQGKGTAFDVPLPGAGGAAPRKLARAGVIRVVCDVHGWMSAWVVVTETPFVAVTDGEGRFAVPGVPAGAWEATLWHERLGEKRARVTVPASGAATLEAAWP